MIGIVGSGMTDPFLDTSENGMSRSGQTTINDPAVTAEQIRQSLTGRHVCPFCGQLYSGSEPCPRCTMEDTPATRQATRSRVGPWYVLQSRNPTAPGMKYAMLLALINKGQVTPRSIIRGPTTHQLWRFAAHVRGVSREFGLCYSCGQALERTCSICPHCQRSQEPPPDPDVLLEIRSNAQITAEQFLTPPNTPSSLNETHVSEPRQSPSSDPRWRYALTRRGGSRVVSAMELAAALQSLPAGQPEKSGRKALSVLLVLLVLLAGAAAATWYFKPEYADQARKWFDRSWQVCLKLLRRDTPPISNPPVARAKQQSQTPQPAQASVETIDVPAGASQPQPNASTPTDQVDAAFAIEQARSLWKQAIDAEAAQDFVTAARIYQQIKTLPPEAWPAGLQLRLDNAQNRSRQSSAQ